jgi:rhamnulokinase
MTQVAAVDLGASSGRVIVGSVGAGRLATHEVHRFPNVPVNLLGTLHWDILRLYADVLDGLRAAGREFGLASVGIDSWAVDYGLLDSSGALLGNPVHYRDARTEGAAAAVHGAISPAELYATTGTAQLPFNTIYQLAAAAGTPQLGAARTLLLIPDLLAYWLTGETGAEITNASTTQLLDVRAGGWAMSLVARAGIPSRIFPPLRRPGEIIGQLLPGGSGGHPPGQQSIPNEPWCQVPAVPVIAVGSHDTASSVAAVPARGRDFAYISSGTWSLVGVELDEPVLTERSRLAGFSNEAGVDSRVRYLRNVMGLWLLQESLRSWAAAGQPADLETLLDGAAKVPPLRAVIDPDDPVFLPPGDMPARIASACRSSGQAPPAGQAETVRCILDSLALAYRRALHEVQELSGREVSVVHVVGGGARNSLLCQLTADACGLPVIAGPVEAAALGNILVQARALGAAPGDLDGMRALLRATQELRRFEPAGGTGEAGGTAGAASEWDAAARRVPQRRPA